MSTALRRSRAEGAGALPGNWDGLVVLCAANAWDRVKVADQHLATHLSAHAPVLYVDPPLSRLTPIRHPELGDSLQRPRLRLLRPGLARLTPVVTPAPHRPGVSLLTTQLAARAIRSATRALGGDVGAVITTWTLEPIYAGNPRLKVYWAQDDVVGGARGMDLSPERVARGESKLAREADVVIAANPVVADTFVRRGNDTRLIPFGCDLHAFARTDDVAPAEDVALTQPIAGLVGQLNSRIDLALLEAVADRGHSLLLVGPRDPSFLPDRFAALLRRPNVQHVGPRSFEDLPRYLRVMDVGLVPYTDSPFNRGSFPLKMLEYLAAGRAVVSTDLPAVRWLDSDLITVASSAEFADSVTRELGVARTDELVRRRQSFAARHSWERRAAEFADVLGVAREARSTGGR